MPNVYAMICLRCPETPEFSEEQPAKAIAQHLRDAHGFPESIHATRSLIQHLDAEEWYESRYEWSDSNGPFALEIHCMERQGSNNHLWSGKRTP